MAGTQVPHVNVIILTPGNGVTKHYLTSLLATIDCLSRNKISFTFNQHYSSHVGDAREVTLNGSLINNFLDQRPFQGQVSYDKLMWIDSDIGWTPDDFLKLYNSEKDIISGAYLLGDSSVAAHKEQKDGGSAYTREEVEALEEPVSVVSAGMGFMCIKKGVFENLSRPWFQSATHEAELESGDKHKFNIMGEDVSFCYRARALGYDIWLDPKVKVIHQKQFLLTWEGLLYT